MNSLPCPFCGIVADTPHESQACCIAALQEEIARVRRLLRDARPLGSPDREPEERRRDSA